MSRYQGYEHVIVGSKIHVKGTTKSDLLHLLYVSFDLCMRGKLPAPLNENVRWRTQRNEMDP